MREEEDGGGGGEGEASPGTCPRMVPSKSLDVPEAEGAGQQASKLCGYLTKQSGKGPLRGYKPRWFVYDPRKCYLYYFKTPQDALPLGHIDISDACFSYDLEGEEGQFEIRTAGKEFLLKAPSRQVMHFWLQQLQQKRWEYSNTRGSGQRDSWSSPITADPPTGLVHNDNDGVVFEKFNDSMEKVRSDFALEAEVDSAVGDSPSSRGPTGAPANPLNTLRNIGTELRNSMSSLRSGRDSRRSVFYTANSSTVDEWELLDAPPKDVTTEGKHNEAHRHSFGSTFPFDFGRNSSRNKRPLLPGRPGRGSADMSVECNGSRPVDLQQRLQNQQEELCRLQQEQTQLREELLTHKELVRLLQQTLRTSQCDWQALRRGPQTSAPSDPNSPAPEHPEPPPAVAPEAPSQLERLLQDRDAQIQSLCGHMERLALEKDSLQKELKGLKLKVGEMNEQLGMLMETIQAKDEVIMKLSQEQSSEGGHSEPGSPPFTRDQNEVDILKDSLQGYKTQNKFLNKEILELTVLRRNSESRERALEAKCTALEAKLCQVESKYLVLLQEVKTPVCGSEQSPAREVISRLLEDALQGEGPEHDQLLLKPNTVSEYDVFGFKTVPEEEEEEERLVAKVRALELKTLAMTDQEVSVGVKWENYLTGTMNRNLTRSPELKSLVRCGVPHEHRSKLWRWAVSFHVKKLREHLAPDYYETLLNVAKEKPNPASKQIELDLLRTLPNNKHYSSPSAAGIQKLRNVLTAFSWRNPDIGYCQGLNRLAAIALLYLDQEDAFWTLIAIVEVFMPRDYYTKTLLGSQVDQRVFKDLMSEKLPRLHAHFEQHKVDFSLITFNWFLVVFVDSVVSDILFKIWDAFLYEGPKIIFRFALALFKYKEEEFLKLQDSTAIFKYLRYFTRTILDSRKLMSMAFVDMNPFPMRQIQSRRAFHLEKVRLELNELEAIRQTFLRERESSQDGRSFVSDDDEDN
ncbi:LOW QUALITY PROTEIN: TBC1 domain family member 2B [Boleophthalmus pectinirostris]|uniref:LOW QUALITY PROTEIN: TBC1 domain family member 2B n=1 Tax=Boleophthalmus pectinirostris TaxID=150288 RepID=UPI002431816B|nr:LOW QUALITY PROTEIN: TBC1 domain family member 2B [Boleophthalmus pectinirostris]